MYLSNKNQADFSLPTNWSIEQLKPKALASFMKAGVGTKFLMTMVIDGDGCGRGGDDHYDVMSFPSIRRHLCHFDIIIMF